MPTINFTLEEALESLDVPAKYKPIPDGDYTCVIIDSEVKPTKSGNGHYLQLVLEVLEGAHAGRKLFERLNIDNPSSKAVAIARKRMTELCSCVGITGELRETEELHNIPVKVSVVVEEPKNGYDSTNRIVGYHNVTAAANATRNEASTTQDANVTKSNAMIQATAAADRHFAKANLPWVR